MMQVALAAKRLAILPTLTSFCCKYSRRNETDIGALSSKGRKSVCLERREALSRDKTTACIASLAAATTSVPTCGGGPKQGTNGLFTPVEGDPLTATGTISNEGPFAAALAGTMAEAEGRAPSRRGND